MAPQRSLPISSSSREVTNISLNTTWLASCAQCFVCNEAARRALWRASLAQSSAGDGSERRPGGRSQDEGDNGHTSRVVVATPSLVEMPISTREDGGLGGHLIVTEEQMPLIDGLVLCLCLQAGLDAERMHRPAALRPAAWRSARPCAPCAARVGERRHHMARVKRTRREQGLTFLFTMSLA